MGQLLQAALGDSVPQDKNKKSTLKNAASSEDNTLYSVLKRTTVGLSTQVSLTVTKGI